MWKRAVSSIILVGAGVVAASCGPNLEDHWNNPSTFPYPDDPPATIDVLSYNVFLRPGSISTRDYTACRGRAIGEQLADMQPDIVALQESWEKYGVSSLVEESQRRLPYRVLSKPKKRLFDNATGGLSILSKWPIEAVRTHRYSDCNGEDCYASKGILHAVIRVSEASSVQVVTTHLDSGHDPEDRQARANQLAELDAFVADIDRAVGPVVLLGDFNVDGIASADEYEHLVTTLDANEDFALGASTVNCETNVFCEAPSDPQQLDYVFTQAGEWRLIRHETEHLAMPTDTCGSDVKFLSDHRVVSTRYDTLF